ncbi:unnamed protein product, partial [Meganyctiphanes norvegica]
NGEKLVWQQYETEISQLNRLWWPILPGKWYSKIHCLLLLSYRSNWISHPNQPYITYPCSISHRTLCEDPANMQFNPKDVFVSPNEKVHLYCGIGTDYSYCIWEKDTNIITIENVNRGLYRGISRPEKKSNNQCGIVLDQASIEDQGIWTCKVYRNGEVFMDSKNVILKVNSITPPPCYRECGIEHDWVCGSDGNSYQNPCQLKEYSCEHPRKNITIKHDRRCEDIKGECPDKPFKIKGSALEFIIFFDKKRNWLNAKKKCEAETMLTAHPSDKVAVRLRKYLLDS